jgi:hypothetical protein
VKPLLKGLTQCLTSLVVSSALSTMAVGQSAVPGGDDRVIGTWELDVGRSSYTSGPPPRSQTRTYERHPDGVKATIVTVDAEGQTTTIEYVADYDGIEYPITGTPNADAIAFMQVLPNEAEAVMLHAGRVVGTARRAISSNGERMTIVFRLPLEGRGAVDVLVLTKQG